GWLQRLTDLWGGPLSESDHALVANYLDDPGKFLFYQMDPIDQRHTIKVARRLLHEVAFRRGVDTERLIQAALLHDAGKVKGDINRFYRVLVGLIRRIAPGLRSHWASGLRKYRFRYACYVDLVHPGRGAYMASLLGVDVLVVDLIREHHEPRRHGQTPELSYLQAADNAS
ncbi:MAG TPA: HD domain-containing protein, partial [Bacillota bacterium]|nr:HD domain-containing protein [Bacillota bacterium]